MIANPFNDLLAILEADVAYQEPDIKSIFMQAMGLPVTSKELESNNVLLIDVSDITLPDATLQFKDSFLKPTLTGDTLTGYCAVWLDDKGQEWIDEYKDHVAKGSWAWQIQQSKKEAQSQGHDYLMPLLWQHIPPKQGGLLGKVTDLKEDDRGVFFQAKLASVSKARDAYQHAKNGTVGASYGFRALDYEYLPHPTKQYETYRRIKKMEVGEVSIVPVHSHAANPYTFVEAKQALMHQIKGSSGYDTVRMRKLFNQLDDTLTKLQLEVLRSRE